MLFLLPIHWVFLSHDGGSLLDDFHSRHSFCALSGGKDPSKYRIIYMFLKLNTHSNFQPATRRYNFEVHNFTAKRLNSIFKGFECDFRKISTNRYSMSVHLSLSRPIARNAEIAMTIHYRLERTTKIVKFLDVKFNLCDTLALQNIPVPLFKAIFNEVMRKSNVPFSCPIAKVRGLVISYNET